MTAPDDATRAQLHAARPDVSTWLAANAGSGKTRVLTDRVARLLLKGVEPQQILCLTYTKAAASEMQNRLFKRLGAWAMLEDDALRKELQELGAEGAFGDPELKQARTLFARAIETPGGLKIQTIHSFCASLLRRFPLEARVSPQFTEIEDRAADLLRAEIVDQMAEGDDGPLVSDLAGHYTGEDFDKLTRAIVKYREGFAQRLDRSGAAKLFGLPDDFDPASLATNVITPDVQDWMPQVCTVLANHTKTMVAMAEVLATVDTQNPNDAGLERLKSQFLYREGEGYKPAAKTGSIPTKKAALELGPLLGHFHQLMERAAQAHEQMLASRAVIKTVTLHRFAEHFLPLYEAAKTQRGWLDFDDLIDRARALLNDEKVAAWVLFRIDGGIDHILVDEAQDTSPAQWDVIRKLSAEFTSGQGARENTDRTIFVVGDKKQSIYSFQGADPREFDRMQSEFEAKFQAAEKQYQNRTLDYSFRSSSAILNVVDRTFVGKQDAGFVEGAQHFAFKSKLPGRVDLWPLVEKNPEEEDRAWYDPLDRKSPQHHDVILAGKIALQIKQMIDDKQTIPDSQDGSRDLMRRPVKAGDFLILVQRRSTLFSEIIRACKAHNLPIAGADRLKVGGELAVRDLAALLSFLAVPEDDLALAAALKSPLFGWSEQQLFDLAHRRTQDHLWQALRARHTEYPDTMDILNDLRRTTDFLRPYDLIERILTRHKGRKNLLARLGTEAEDGINALLSQALAYERNAVPSLTGFLVWMETDDLEIKRQIDSASDQIRVMTVHGAKGLEAPIVILPETGKRVLQVKDDIVRIDDTPVWKPGGKEMPQVMATTIEGIKNAQTEERLRLLYVALTRAQTWLIVAAAGDHSKEGDTWFQQVDAALDAQGARMVDVNGMAVKRWAEGDWESLPYRLPTTPTVETETLDPCFARSAPAVTSGPETLSPSDLGGAKALPGKEGRDEEAAKAYGTLVHHYLEHLDPAQPDDWADVTAELSGDDLQAATEAQAVLRAPALAPVFAAGTLGEVAVTATLGAARLHGIIDRLIVEDARVFAVDFKTNQAVPDSPDACPEGILRQMGAYAHALQQIYPDKRIETAIVWTRTATLMALPHDIVMQALQRSPYLDAGAGAT